jgi:hypothetical protein
MTNRPTPCWRRGAPALLLASGLLLAGVPVAAVQPTVGAPAASPAPPASEGIPTSALTPAYKGDPATPKVVPQDQWFRPPAAKSDGSGR